MFFLFLIFFLQNSNHKDIQQSWEDFFPDTEFIGFALENEKYLIQPIGPLLMNSFYINSCQFMYLKGVYGGAIMYSFTMTSEMTKFQNIDLLFESSYFYSCAADTGAVLYSLLYNIGNIPNIHYIISKTCCSLNSAETKANLLFSQLNPTDSTYTHLYDSSFVENGFEDNENTTDSFFIQHSMIEMKRNNISHNYAGRYPILYFYASPQSEPATFSYNSFSSNEAKIESLFYLIPSTSYEVLAIIYFDNCNFLFNKQSLTSPNGLIMDDFTTVMKYCSFYENVARTLFTFPLFYGTIIIEKSFIDLSKISDIGLLVSTDEYASSSYLNEIDCLNTYNCYAKYDTFLPEKTPIRTIERTPEITTAAPTPQITTPSRSPTISKQPATKNLPYPGFYSNDNSDKGEIKVGGVRLPIFAGIVVASFVVIVLVIFIVLYIIRTRNSEENDDDLESSEQENPDVGENLDSSKDEDENYSEDLESLDSFDETSSEI